MLNGVMLVLIAAWAIVAVILLIGTLSAADSIQGRVGSIKGSLSSANQDLDYVRLTHRTARIARGIAAAARPLSGQLNREIAATGSIRRRVGSIDRTVFAITGTAHSIDANVASIEGRVRSIAGNVVAIHDSAGGIEADAGSVLAHVRSTYGSVLGINGRFTGTRASVKSIDARVAGINARAERAISVAGKIHDRLAAVLAQVGIGHGTPLDAPIHGHANSIDCRVRGSYCDH